ncbi:hypothetical protein SR870_12310 [Rhodopseudomonas palustris]|uniref:hypothetical protein n=1 Tax=Rhodopseudomonas palustris TaxID=1076 RepID=UPI002ACDA6F9|nr:hypothetical protein [Rhodopseudomonas palustris]WQG97504.1 hypothetical protein SR870_12310 [Rhodopseudomonas palustris]
MNETDHRAELDRHLAWFESKLPPKPAHFVGWLRRPTSKYVRLPVGVLLIGGGVFSFLPVLGFWMLPLGLVLIAQDVPALEKPTARTLGWVERKWVERQRKKGRDITPFVPDQQTGAAATASDDAGESRMKA